MASAAPPDEPDDLSIFEKSCAYCGARFRVVVAHLPYGDHAEEYACPECGKHYQTEASEEPEVRLIKPRSDGKSDRYQDTMF